MSVRLEIIGESAEEFVGQLRAIAAAMSPGGVMPEVVAQQVLRGSTTEDVATDKGEPQAPDKPTRTRRSTKTETAATAQEPDASEQTSTKTTAGSDAPHSASAEPEPEPSTTGSSGPSDTPATSDRELPSSYDSDVAPLVTDAVIKHGKDKVVAILSEFGVAKASELETPERWQELLDRLADLDTTA